MGAETEQFLIFDVRWSLPDAEPFRPDRHGLAPPRTGIRSAAFTCKPCSNHWVGSEGLETGQFQSVNLGEVWISCPRCGVEEVVRISTLG